VSRDWRLYLDDIVSSSEKIGRFIEGMCSESFIADEKTRAAVEWHLFVIGEAAKHLPESERQLYPDVEWRKIAGLRDVLAHGYFGIDDEILWDVVKNKVPVLLAQLGRGAAK
jgi:uncharacterized protein with HEPN domain